MHNGEKGLNPEAHHDWTDLYNTPEGKNNVDVRQKVYELLPEGVEPVDYDQAILDYLKYAGVDPMATITDVGSSYPAFLMEKCPNNGFVGQGNAIEPNSQQFNGLAYLKLSKPGDRATLEHQEGRVINRVKLFEAGAGLIPLENASTDVVTTIFSGYHVYEDIRALREIKRILKPDGILADATSGRENKEEMIEDEERLAKALSEILGEDIIPPPALQSGFTAEAATRIFPLFFSHVYVKWVKQDVQLQLDKEAVLAAHRTYRTSYKAVSGNIPRDARDPLSPHSNFVSPAIFEHALENVVGSKLDTANARGEIVPCKVRRTIIMASDVVLNLPLDAGFEEIT